jgi:hypothetical protein
MRSDPFRSVQVAESGAGAEGRALSLASCVLANRSSTITWAPGEIINHQPSTTPHPMRE